MSENNLKPKDISSVVAAAQSSNIRKNIMQILFQDEPSCHSPMVQNGHKREQSLRKLCEYSRKKFEDGSFIVKPDAQYLTASPDAILMDEGKILEVPKFEEVGRLLMSGGLW